MTLPDENSNVINVPGWKSLWNTKTRCLNKQRYKINRENVNLNVIHEQYNECLKDNSIYTNSIGRVCTEFDYFTNLPHEYNVTQKRQYITTGVEWNILRNIEVS